MAPDGRNLILTDWAPPVFNILQHDRLPMYKSLQHERNERETKHGSQTN